MSGITKELKEFLSGVIGEEDLNDKKATSSSNYTIGNDSHNLAYGLALKSNQAATLKEGNFLILYDESCYQLDPNTGEYTFLFELHKVPRTILWTAIADFEGNIYCTASGEISPKTPQEFITFGEWGGLFKVNYKEDKLQKIGNFVDPLGIEFTSNNNLLVADFNGFGGTGKIWEINVVSGTQRVILEGWPFVDPQGVHLDNDGVYWISNGMHDQFNGNIIRAEPGKEMEVFWEQKGTTPGTVISVFPSNTDSKIITVTVDWPMMATSKVVELDKKTGKAEILLTASPDSPKIYGPNFVIVDDILWMPETYEKKILGFNLKTKKIVKEIDTSPITGSMKGLTDPFTFIEYLSVIPPQKKKK